jgi:hypothetical protein
VPTRTGSPRNSLERALGPHAVSLLEHYAHRVRAGQQLAIDDQGELGKLIEKIFLSAVSLDQGGRRPKGSEDWETFRSIAYVAAWEALKAERPRKQRTQSTAGFLRNAMQTEMDKHRELMVTPPIDGDAIVQTSDAAADKTRSDVEAIEPDVFEDVSAEVNDTNADDPPDLAGPKTRYNDELAYDSEYATAILRSRRAKSPRHWKESRPELHRDVAEPIATTELRERERRAVEAAEESDFQGMIRRSSAWSPGDAPLNSAIVTAANNKYARLANTLLWVNPEARENVERVSHWLKHGDGARRRPRVYSSQSVALNGPQRLPNTPNEGVWETEYAVVYREATPREQQLWDSQRIGRGQRSRGGLSQLSREWGETVYSLEKERTRVVGAFHERARAAKARQLEADARLRKDAPKLSHYTTAWPEEWIAEDLTKNLALGGWRRKNAVAASRRALDPERTEHESATF